MIEFFLYGYLFKFDGIKFSGENNYLVDLYNLFIDQIRGYFPIGHNLFIILSSIYPDEKFDFINEDRNKFFYVISTPDEIKNSSDNIII